MEPMPRRVFLKYAAVATVSGGLAAACSSAPPQAARFITPADPEIAARERALAGSATVVPMALSARPVAVDLGGVVANTWGFASEAVGPEIRLQAGERLRAEVANDLPVGTTIHWHGIAIRNDMDGVPVLTQPPIAPGQTFVYEAVMPDPGTYWYHSHSGLQLDRGLSGPLIIEDPNESLQYDHEWTVFLKDWMDGITGTPDDVLRELSAGMGGMEGMGGESGTAQARPQYMLTDGKSALLGGDAGDVNYPYYLVNGRISTDPPQFTAKPGDRARLRIINAGADTAFRVALGGHELMVTHTDGFPINQLRADALLLGMGERYDALVTLKDGVFPLIASAEGKNARALAIVRTGPGGRPPPDVSVAELDGNVPMAWDMSATEADSLPRRDVVRTLDIRLTGSMSPYTWSIDGVPFDPSSIESNRFGVRGGERVRITWRNDTDMWHPMHLHGHTFQIAESGSRNDTVIVLPKTAMTTYFDADNPGRWAFHCHNSFHQDRGMMGSVSYEV
ncbi:multicopper oxidase family protein [Rhodococcus sp. NPDC058514]|uniref:multicopper oxidase family protein n=1 Tax=unclassified Rhodococcus (in: high G+C Gram-positive bacteria) TaxID=192944 RepID=UPI0036616FE4